jgi:4-hydroxy-3-polyprenylbenzoate decarboxylase
MTMRRDAVYPSIVVGKPPAEDAWLGKATERIFPPAIRRPCRDRRLRPADRGRVPQLRDRLDPQDLPGQALNMHAVWGLGRCR